MFNENLNMRFLTKEWFKISNRAIWDDNYIFIDEKAENFDEDFFDQLYKKRESKYVKAFIEIYKGVPNVDKIRKAFRGRFEELLSIVDTFPNEILRVVADKRVLALGVASSRVKQIVLEYTKNQHDLEIELLNKSIDNIDKVEIQTKSNFGLNKYVFGELNNITADKNEVTLHFKDIPNLIMKNAKIILQEDSVKKGKGRPGFFSKKNYMIGKELEKVGDRFIVKFLMEKYNGYERVNLWKLIVSCENIIWE